MNTYFLLLLIDISTPKGNVYIADFFNSRIRKVTISTGIITTFAGTTSYGYSGDNGAATSTTLQNPSGVALDTSGTDINCTAWHSILCTV